jgi:hypothetical protein
LIPFFQSLSMIFGPISKTNHLATRLINKVSRVLSVF